MTSGSAPCPLSFKKGAADGQIELSFMFEGYSEDLCDKVQPAGLLFKIDRSLQNGVGGG